MDSKKHRHLENKSVFKTDLSEEEAEIVSKAVDFAAKDLGVQTNRKRRLGLVEVCRFYLHFNTLSKSEMLDKALKK